jgi:hypothetical protein
MLPNVPKQFEKKKIHVKWQTKHSFAQPLLRAAAVKKEFHKVNLLKCNFDV